MLEYRAYFHKVRTMYGLCCVKCMYTSVYTGMKISTKVIVAFTILLTLPLLASAQVNTSVATQQTFLTQLQALQQELAALAATINAMITAAGGTPASIAPSTASSNTSGSLLPLTAPSIANQLRLGGLFVLDGSDTDFSSQLLQAIVPSVSTTTFVARPTSVVATSGTSVLTVAATHNVATQNDPSCLSSLFANNAQCSGLYYCTVGSYWSSTMCTAN